MKIEIQGLRKQFADLVAINNVELLLEEGIYGLIGPNGSGKSTLIQMLVTLLTPTSGSILVDGEMVNSSSSWYSNQIGLMPQNMNGYAEFSVERFMYYMATLKGLNKKEAKKEIHELLENVNMLNNKDKKIKNLSGGMRQRLMFSQALLNSPKVLILDEPTAGLDPEERIRMRNFISKKSKGKIVIVATHVMQDIESIANAMILLKKGEVVKVDTPQNLLSSLEGKVFEKKIEESELEEYQTKYKISTIT